MKQIIVMGDIEMGAGNLTDDFISDNSLSKVILELSTKDHPVALVLNGDTFDFLKCPSQILPKTIYPRHVTEKISVAKLKLIHKAHIKVFEALKEFVSKKNKKVYFILGNHDHDIIYKEVQNEIRRLIDGNTRNVVFPGLRFKKHGVYVEHGHMYDFLFAINFEKLFLKHKGESILNLPFISFGLISKAMHLKEKNPFLERIFPRPELVTHHRIVAKNVTKHTLGYFFKSLLYYPFRFYSDPTYSFPTGLFRELYRRISTVHWDVDNITNIFIKKRKVRNKIIVLGHIHEKRINKGRRRVVINPGTWRDEYDFNSKTRELIPRSKRYVEITVDENEELSYNLVDIPLNRSILNFDDVIKNEMEYMEFAADEEDLN
jgi:UDP-2,3-diacylglucosamine pyrophosphatase LpxH